MDPVEEFEICKRALEVYGVPAQKLKAIEELSELIVALTNPKKTSEDVIDEIADVSIMMCQLALIYGLDVVNARVDFKLKRLEEMVTADP